MEKLIKAYLRWHDVGRGAEAASCRLGSGEHLLVDPKACRECENAGRVVCGHRREVLRVSVSGEATAFGIEAFNDSLDGLKCHIRECCDLLLTDCRGTLALVEMTCSAGKYITRHMTKESEREGKREKALRQTRSVAEALARVPDIKAWMDTLQRRECVFAYRVKDAAPTDRGAEAMAAFTQSFADDIKVDIGGGFVFRAVRYPAPYRI